MKVYLVFQGCSSGRTCMAVFDNEEQAEKYSELLDKRDYSDVEEHEVNEIDVDNCIYGKFYCVGIFIKDSDKYKKGELSLCSVEESLLETNSKSRCCIEKDDSAIWIWSPISEEHAKKVAIEQYQIYTQQELENEGI